jgi:vacuolar-type H+-ATPase subunit F/Vma7
MSRFLVITRPELLAGFHLAGVDAYSAVDIETAQELIESWWKAGEVGLLAIDDGILEKMNAAFKRRMDANEKLFYVATPGGGLLGPEATRKYRIAEMIRRAIGFHIVFKGEEQEEERQG